MAMKQTLSSKILVTNRAALLAKYGSSGVKAIARAVRPAMSIANTYLHEGAVGVVASTTIAYGPVDDNANADIVCQLFLDHVLRGRATRHCIPSRHPACQRARSPQRRKGRTTRRASSAAYGS